jgi:hypothetical protein
MIDELPFKVVRSRDHDHDEVLAALSMRDAERLRALLRRIEPADIADPSAHERVGKVIAQAMYRPFKR